MQRIALIIILMALSGCVHKMNIAQGNIITDDMVKSLHPGMSEASVRYIMGTPVLMNTFKENRADYVYTFKPGRGKGTEKVVTLMFQNGSLKEINTNGF